MFIPAAASGARSLQQTKLQPPALRGWNARSSLTNMKPGDAIRLDNFVCRPWGLELRPGKQRWMTGAGSGIETLMVYGPRHGDQQLFAATATGIYDVAASRVTNFLEASVTLTPVVGSLTNGRWVWDQMTNAGGTFLVCANGYDGVRVYDGKSWLAPTITCGCATTTLDPLLLDGVVAHQRRLFFFERGTLRVWYLPLGQIGGAAQLIDLSRECTQGGVIVAMATMTADGGRNIDDRIVIVTDQGEMIVFSGVAPERAATWSKAGAWQVPPPVAKRCFAQHGGDVVYLSTTGVLPVSQILSRPDPEKPVVALTEPIRRAYDSAARLGETKADWTLIESAKNRFTLINAPTYEGSAQLVLSADGGWSAFVGLDATCWTECGVDLFMGTADGDVFRLAGTQDDGGPVSGFVVDAYSRHGTGSRKVYKRSRPIFAQPAAMTVRQGLYTNFRPIPGTLSAPTETWGGVPWTWDSLTWALQPPAWTAAVRGVTDVWRGLTGRGHAAALMTTVSSTESVVYEGSEIGFEIGGQL